MRLLVAALLLQGSLSAAAEFTYLAPGDRGRALCVVPPPTGAATAPAGSSAGSAAGSGAGSAAGGQPDFSAPDFDDASYGLAPDAGTIACDALRIRRKFDVGAELPRLASLTLEVRYQDGFVAYLNGVEVARRRFVDGAPLAVEAHGGEPERFYLPVSPGLLRKSGNVLAVEVRPFKPGRAPFADTALLGADAAHIVRGPYLQRVLDGGADVLLETDLPTTAEIRYGPDSAAGKLDGLARDDKLDTRHLIHLTGLEPARTYRYRVAVREPAMPASVPAAEQEAFFHTPPTATHPLRFVLVGDVRTGHDIHAEIVRAITAEDPDLVIVTGDLVDTGSDEAEWQRYFDIEAPLLRQVPSYPTVGNHDSSRRGVGLERFLALFPRPGGRSWESFDVGGVHFILLDSEHYTDRAQLDWLKQDLDEARARRPRAIFACAHHGPWSSAMHGDNPIAIRDYVPILEKGGVTMFLGGHDHDYERGQVGELPYLVSGGGGAELRAPRCSMPGAAETPTKRRCRSQVKAFVNEHHYVVLEVTDSAVRICPKRPDGTLLEDCPTVPLR